MIPLQFRSLPKERTRNFAFAILALRVMAMLCASLEANAAKGFEKSYSELAQDCVTARTSRGIGDFKTSGDGSTECVYNKGLEFSTAGIEVDAYNATVLNGQENTISTYRENFGFKEEAPVGPMGACRLAYLSIDDVRKAYQVKSSEICNKVATSLSEAMECTSKNASEKCPDKWAEAKNTIESSSRELTDFQNNANKYFNFTYGKAKWVFDKYNTDKAKFCTTALKPKAAANNCFNTSFLGTPITASSGYSNSCIEYKSRLINMPIATISGTFLDPNAPIAGQCAKGSLIAEQEEAYKKVDLLKGKLADQIKDLNSTFAGYRNIAENELKHSENLDSVGPGMKEVTQTASTAAPAITGMLHPESALSTGGGTSPTPPSLATLAAAGAVGAAAANSFKGAASRNPGSFEPPARNSQAAPNTTSLASPLAKESETALKKASEEDANGVKADTSKFEEGVSFNANNVGDGASRALASKGKSAGGPATSASGGKVGGEDSMGDFRPNLAPRPNPKASNPSGEVANLLGQMKNLFNFDDAGGMGGAMGGGMPNTSFVPEASASNEGEGETPAEEAVAEGEEESAPEVGEEAEAPTEQASPFGKKDVTLFARVRTRHAHCLEKGLVYYGDRRRLE